MVLSSHIMDTKEVVVNASALDERGLIHDMMSRIEGASLNDGSLVKSLATL